MSSPVEKTFANTSPVQTAALKSKRKTGETLFSRRSDKIHLIKGDEDVNFVRPYDAYSEIKETSKYSKNHKKSRLATNLIKTDAKKSSVTSSGDAPVAGHPKNVDDPFKLKVSHVLYSIFLYFLC